MLGLGFNLRVWVKKRECLSHYRPGSLGTAPITMGNTSDFTYIITAFLCSATVLGWLVSNCWNLKSWRYLGSVALKYLMLSLNETWELIVQTCHRWFCKLSLSLGYAFWCKLSPLASCIQLPCTWQPASCLVCGTPVSTDLVFRASFVAMKRLSVLSLRPTFSNHW